MATNDIELVDAGVYYEVMAAGVDEYATNSSSRTVHVRTSPTQPANFTPGHTVPPGESIVRDPSVTDIIWAMCFTAGAAIRIG